MYSVCGTTGLWIRIHFMRIQIQQFFWMRIRNRIVVYVQLTQIYIQKKIKIFYLVLQDLDLDPVAGRHWEKLMDPDAHKMNADPQHYVDAKINF